MNKPLYLIVIGLVVFCSCSTQPAYKNTKLSFDKRVEDLVSRMTVEEKISHGREKIALTGAGWKAWIDNEASWQNDKLYLPDEITNIDNLPHNMPTGGWSVLDAVGRDCHIPASIEELFSGGVNTWTYHGVSWFWKDVRIPAAWQGKTVHIVFADTRMRAEVYVNSDLAGYDLVAETPWKADISSYLNYNSVNRIAIRLTNPGGDRGWQDFPFIEWGDYKFPHSHDFTGIGGTVTLVATDAVYIDDIFIKNELPALANNISLHVAIRNKGATENLTMQVDILPTSGGTGIYNNSWHITANGDALTSISNSMTVAGASLWSIDNPNLYQCVVRISGGGKVDSLSQTFGFRVFEARENNNLYFNNKRVRFRSAIDWGFYAISGYYATDMMARLSVQNAKDIGHNQINFHRTIGEPLVMKYADELGLYLYEEPGAFHAGEQEYEIVDDTFAGKIMYEKVRRMVVRDRNHPSLVQYNLCNEDNGWNTLRERAMKLVNTLDNSVIVTNTSAWSDETNHIRPYESTIRSDLADHHTVEAEDRFQESDLESHSTSDNDNLRYWGEVRCYTGPPNWYNVGTMRSLSGSPGYDENIYKPLHDDILDYFSRNNLSTNGSKIISSPSEVSIQAGRGLMYIDGRLGQVIMLSDPVDGYAINGWTAGPQAAEVIPDEDFNWESAILDEARNLKGVASDFAYWVRDLQIAIIRQNGKYFKPGDNGEFEIHLINEGRISAGNYTLSIRVNDGVGTETAFQRDVSVVVTGGDTYAQKLIDSLVVPFDASYHAGHITIEGKLYAGTTVVADGAEQVLLQNRPSWHKEIAPYTIAVSGWDAAKTAIQDAGVTVVDFSTSSDKLDFICAAGMPDASLSNMLDRVNNDGTTLIIKFTQEWADALVKAGLLSKNVTHWISGDTQTSWWNGNGWGYLDYYIGDRAVPSKSTISTNSWEVPSDPQGFYPFESPYLQTAYGAHFARPDKFQYSPDLPDDKHSTSVLIGAIQYGNGKVILDASYWVDDNHALNDMLFYNFIKHGSAVLCYGQPPYKNTSLSIDERVEDLVSRMTVEEKISQMSHLAPGIKRLGVIPYEPNFDNPLLRGEHPDYSRQEHEQLRKTRAWENYEHWKTGSCFDGGWWNSALHGVGRCGLATSFPQCIGQGSTWNPGIIQKANEVASTEARIHSNVYGKKLSYWSPTINILRDPRWGRNEESFSEDPYLLSRMAVAVVKGFQGYDDKYLKAIATPKHFVANNSEYNRHEGSANVSERFLREYYFPAYKAAIMEGGAYSVMNAYNAVNGTPTAVDKWLLTDILRNEWGFKGYVVSDCGAVSDIVHKHKYETDKEKAVAMAVKAGLDLECETCETEQFLYDKYLPGAYKKGYITEEEIDVAVKRLFRARMLVGEFDPPSEVPYTSIPREKLDSKEHRQLALEVARESIVLLKNDGILPLNKEEIKKVAVIGPNANICELGGYAGMPAVKITPLMGIQELLGENIEVNYAKGCEIVSKEDETTTIIKAVELAKNSDVALLFVGTNLTVANEHLDRDNLDLPGNQLELIKKVYKANPNTVVVLINGMALTINWVDENISAILEAWYPGQAGGTAIADVLFGAYNPGGKLPVTFYKNFENLPPMDEYDITKGHSYWFYKGEVLYPFGYGLSYTTFEYSDLEINKDKFKTTDENNIQVEFSVQNTGKMKGDEVVQLYVRDLESSVIQPSKRLRKFKRITLERGESKTAAFALGNQDFSYWDENTKDWTIEPGEFEIQIGASLIDIKLKDRISAN